MTHLLQIALSCCLSLVSPADHTAKSHGVEITKPHARTRVRPQPTATTPPSDPMMLYLAESRWMNQSNPPAVTPTPNTPSPAPANTRTARPSRTARGARTNRSIPSKTPGEERSIFESNPEVHASNDIFSH